MLRTATQWLLNAAENGQDRFYVRTALAVQQISRTGLTPTYSAANVDGHSIANSDGMFLHVKTTSTGCTVTLQTPVTVDGQAVVNKTVVLGTSTERMIGPFPPSTYNQSDQSVNVDFSAVTGVTCAAFRPTS